ncbi:hypothetical protein [Streptomyces turgidiscabies]|nr:hypothetical protein T45_00694 [Streptomyces turgidiscabies]
MEKLEASDVLGHMIIGFDEDGLLILDNRVKLPGTRIVMVDDDDSERVAA